MAGSSRTRCSPLGAGAAAALIGTLMAFGSSSSTSSASAVTTTSNDSGFVSVNGTKFYRDGKPFRFILANIYDAAGATSSYACNETDRMTPKELDTMFGSLRESGVDVVRFWAYQTYTAGGDDFSGIHQLVNIAKESDVLLLPVLEDGPGHCTTHERPKFDIPRWYTNGYKSRLGMAKLSYRDYVAKFAREFKDERQFLGIELFNEAGSKQRVGENSVLFGFAQDMLKVVKDIDKNHPVTLGTQSNDAPGGSGADFGKIYQMFDFAVGHDWSAWGHGNLSDALPGSIDNGRQLPDGRSEECQDLSAPLACSVAIAKHVLKKPFIIDESGIRADSDVEHIERAEMMKTRMQAAFRLGISGYGLWHVTNGADSQHFDISPQHHDPVLIKTKNFGNCLRDVRSAGYCRSIVGRP